MNVLKWLKLQFSPPRLQDPAFGELVFMYIENDPQRSYWEAEWTFPPTGTPVSIALNGDERGPRNEAREFYLALPARFEEIVEACRPALSGVFRGWLDRDLPEDIFSELKLAGFGVENPGCEPLEWDVAFETTGRKWLGIVVPFRGAAAQEPMVDT